MLSSQLSDGERFKYSEKPCLRCLYCKQRFVYEGVVRRSLGTPQSQSTMHCGLLCPNSTCSRALPSFSIIAQMTCAARDFIQKYYDANLECDEPSCTYRTRKIPLSVIPRCFMAGCQGILHFEVRQTPRHGRITLSHLDALAHVRWCSPVFRHCPL
jgi:DNA polymerase alpha subunit A